jgi:hypothetical protein
MGGWFEVLNLPYNGTGLAMLWYLKNVKPGTAAVLNYVDVNN